MTFKNPKHSRSLESSDNVIIKGSIFDLINMDLKEQYNDIVKVITTTVRMTTMVILMTMMIYLHTNPQFPEPLA